MSCPGKGAPGLADRAAGVNPKCDDCFLITKFLPEYQALCRLIFLQALIGPDFEPVLSFRLDRALQDLEALEVRRRSNPVHVGLVVRGIMEDLALRRIDPDCLGGEHG